MPASLAVLILIACVLAANLVTSFARSDRSQDEAPAERDRPSALEVDQAADPRPAG